MNKKTNAKAAASVAPEIQTKPEKAKLTDKEKRDELYAKREKLIARRDSVKEQEKSLDKRIADTNEKIKHIERKMFMEICRERNLTVDDVISVLKKIPEGENRESMDRKKEENE